MKKNLLFFLIAMVGSAQLSAGNLFCRQALPTDPLLRTPIITVAADCRLYVRVRCDELHIFVPCWVRNKRIIVEIMQRGTVSGHRYIRAGELYRMQCGNLRVENKLVRVRLDEEIL